jgi:hypothetical protein
LYLVTHWSYLVRHLFNETAQLRCFRSLFLLHDDAVSLAVVRVIEDYMARLGIDPGFLPLLQVCTWIDRALDHRDRKQALGEVALGARPGNRFVTYLGILAAEPDRLFAGWDRAPT